MVHLGTGIDKGFTINPNLAAVGVQSKNMGKRRDHTPSIFFFLHEWQVSANHNQIKIQIKLGGVFWGATDKVSGHDFEPLTLEHDRILRPPGTTIKEVA